MTKTLAVRTYCRARHVEFCFGHVDFEIRARVACDDLRCTWRSLTCSTCLNIASIRMLTVLVWSRLTNDDPLDTACTTSKTRLSSSTLGFCSRQDKGCDQASKRRLHRGAARRPCHLVRFASDPRALRVNFRFRPASLTLVCRLAVLSTTRPKIVVGLGNSGVGKSSVWNACLGTHPESGPFQVGDSITSVTTDVQTAEGSWFGNKGEPRVTFVDTPGQDLDCCNLIMLNDDIIDTANS